MLGNRPLYLWERIRRWVVSDLSIDLGTANTLIHRRGHGVVLDEPSVVAIRVRESGRITEAVGSHAKDMLGRTPEGIIAIRPLKDGVVADFDVTAEMLRNFIRKIHARRVAWIRPRVLVCIPCRSTQLERRAIREALFSAGIHHVLLIEEPVAAALGAGLRVQDARGCMVVDIGGGTTDIAILALQGVVHSSSLRVGGDRFDESIVLHVRKTHGVLLGQSGAERVKIELGCAELSHASSTLEVSGLDLSEGVPCSVSLTSSEMLAALRESLGLIVHAVRDALEQTPPEIAADIAERGICLTGGGALLRGLDRLLCSEIGVPVYVAEHALHCVVAGAAQVLEMPRREEFKLLLAE